MAIPNIISSMKSDSKKKKKSVSETGENDPSKPSDFTEMIGGSGWWQIKMLLWTTLPAIPTAWNHLAMSFLAYPVDHWCSRPTNSEILLENWLADYVPNVTLKGSQHHSQCEMYNFNITTGLPGGTAVPCESYEYGNEFNSVINEWDVVCDKDWMLSTSQTIYMIGFLISVMVSGQLSDIYGRKPALMGSIGILLIAGIAAAFSTSFMMFAVLRFFVAIGHGGVGLVTYIILIEAVGPEHRARYMVIQGLGWVAGCLILPLITWCYPDWFLIQIIITVPSFLFLSFFWFVPESPRWLLANGSIHKALPILINAAKANGKDVNDLEEKALEFIRRNKKFDIVSFKRKGSFECDECPLLSLTEQSELLSSQANDDKVTTFLDLLRTSNLRKKTLCLYFIWIVIAFTYYGLSMNTNDLQGNAFVNFFLSSLMEVPGTLFCIFTLDRFGRKLPFFFTLMIGGMACLSCIFVPLRLPSITTTLAMVGKLFNSASFVIVYIFSAETFPTVARNVGVGSSSTVARIGSAIAPFMKDLGNINPSIPFILFGILSIISSLVVLKMPETNNQPIPESIEQAENFGKDVNKEVETSEL